MAAVSFLAADAGGRHIKTGEARTGAVERWPAAIQAAGGGRRRGDDAPPRHRPARASSAARSREANE